MGKWYIVVMKTSLNLYFKNDIDTKTKMDAIKALGFDEFFTGIYDQKETMTFAEQMNYAKQIGLGCTMVHCSYYEPDLNEFWLPGEKGEAVADDYIRQIEMCGGLTKNFVVHLNGSFESTVSEIGLRRLEKILKVCEKYDLNLCVENLFSRDEIPYIFAHIKHPLLKICYDSGHNNFLTPDFDVCGRYGKYVAVLHLHENDGSGDQHKKLTIGNAFFNELKKELEFVDNNVVLANEIKHVPDNWQEYLQQALASLRALRK